MIYTDTRLAVHDVLKGTAQSVVVVSEPGGFIGDEGIVIPGSATYETGTDVLVFLRGAGNGRWRTASMALGKYQRDRDLDGRDVFVRAAANIEMMDGEEATDLRDAAAFVQAIRAGDPARAPRLDRNTVSSLSASGPITPMAAGDYALTGDPDGGGPDPTLPVRWGDNSPTGSGQSGDCVTGPCSVEWANGTATQSGNDTSEATVENAIDAWSDDPSGFINLNITGTNILETINTANSVNDIIYNSNEFNDYCEGSIGCGVLRISTSQHTFASQQWYTILEEDVIIRPGPFAQSLFERILAHEVGHGIGIRHSNQGSPSGGSTNVMNSNVGSGGANLGSWDVDALASLYGDGPTCTNVTITSHTPEHSVPYNTTTTLSVGVTGTTPISYQWYEGVSGDTSNPVATTTTYKPLVTEPTQNYWVKVTNCGGLGTENSQTMIVHAEDCIPVSISVQPESKQIDSGQTATLSVTATGSPTIEYQWYEGSAPDTSTPVGDDKKTFKTPALTSSKNYWVKVKNDCNEEISATATVRVGNQCLSPTATPVSTAVATQIFGSANLGVIAGGEAPFTYQWYSGISGDISSPIAGATAETYTAGPFNTAGTFNYWVRVTNLCPQNNTANSATIVVTVECVVNPATPQIFAPGTVPRASSYEVEWTGDLQKSPTFELQEAADAAFTANVRIFTVAALEQLIPAHAEVVTDTRFYYRVRPINLCTQLPGDWSRTVDTLVRVPQPATSRSFQVSVPYGATAPVTQDLFIDGFGETALPGDSYAVSSDAAFLTFAPASGPLPAAGVTVVMTANPGPLDLGSSSATVTIVRTPGPGAKPGIHNTTTVTLPFSMSLVTPVTPDPRSQGAPPGTLIIPAIAHVDRSDIFTTFQSDIRIANISDQEIEYQLTYTPSQADGTQVGNMTTFSIPPTESRSFDDIVAVWYGAGILGETGFGTLEIRPVNAPSEFSTVASSRTYAVTSDPTTGEVIGTLGQFIPALTLDQFVSDFNVNSLMEISLQQIANSADYRTNLGFVEGSGNAATALANLVDSSGNLLAQATVNLPAFGHMQSALTGSPQLVWQTAGGGAVPNFADGRLEVQVTSTSGLVTAYASVLDNVTQDPLMVFPEQASAIQETHYVLPGISDITGGSVFQSDVRIFNGGNEPVDITLGFETLSILEDVNPAPVLMTLQPGQVEVIDDALPELWGLNQTAGALTIDTAVNSSIVATGRTFSPLLTGGTNGQFIPAVTAADAVGVGERPLTILQLEQSPQYRSNLGLVEVTGQPVTVVITGYNPNSKLSVSTQLDLDPNEFFQQNGILGAMFGADTNVYGGRISVQAIGGTGQVAAYGSVVDMATSDPTYVPAQ